MFNLATLVLVAGLSQCPKTVVENHTRLWVKMDQQTHTRAKTRCAHYFPDAPCLKTLRKMGVNRYHAICGKPNE